MKHAGLPPIHLVEGKPDSICSNETSPPTPAIPDSDTPAPRFDIDKTFPAILQPLALLRAIPESQDINALRALAPVFGHCVDAIVHSIPDHVATSFKYHIALGVVTFAKDLFLGHVTEIDVGDQSKQAAIEALMQDVDMVMSSLQGLLHAAAYEAAQLKPLPQLPQDPLSDESSSGSPSDDTNDTPTDSSDTACTSNQTSVTPSPQKKSKVTTLFRQMSFSRSRKKSLAALHSAQADDSKDLTSGYVVVSAHTRGSLAQFPFSIGSSVATAPHPEDDTELWKDRHGLVQLGSLKALVRYLTTPDADSDVGLVDVFFLWFRSFSSPAAALDALIARYDETLRCDSEAHAVQVKMRVAQLLFLWLDHHWRPEDAEVLSSPALTNFAFSRLSKDSPEEVSAKLIMTLHRHARGGEHNKGVRKERTIARRSETYREPINIRWEPRQKKAMLRGDFGQAKLEHFFSDGGSTLLALQLTLLLFEKYCAFEPENAVQYLMTRKGPEDPPTTDVGRKVVAFMDYEKAVHRFAMNSIAAAESVRMRVDTTQFFLELATEQKCHELRNFSSSCLIALACDRPTVIPFIGTLELSPVHEKMKVSLRDFYTRDNQHMINYKKALLGCCCPAVPGMMVFIREVARGCAFPPCESHPISPGAPLINLKRYRPLTWAVRAMERCHTPFKIQRVDYVCDWLEYVLSEYMVGSEAEWEQHIYDNYREAQGSKRA